MKQDKKSILFIAWDAPHVTYMQSLFLPIFNQLSIDKKYKVSILHFTWSDADKVEQVRKLCNSCNVDYFHRKVHLKPFFSIGKFLTLIGGMVFINNYLKKGKFDVIIPRSSMPALMCFPSITKRRKWKLIYDADGLPIEERVDFAGLKLHSLRHKLLKFIERKILKKADLILTRSTYASDYLSGQHDISKGKFFKVINGRDQAKFKIGSVSEIEKLKADLNIPYNSKVLIYCGSLGPQYGIDEMLYIHKKLNFKVNDVYFLIVANNPEYLKERGLSDKVIMVKADHSDVPRYLSIGDLAFAIRKQSFSMQGVAPIKIGEYLLMGLPVLASAGIGDSDIYLRDEKGVYFLEKNDQIELDESMEWVSTMLNCDMDKNLLRKIGINYFSVEEASKSYAEALKQILHK